MFLKYTQEELKIKTLYKYRSLQDSSYKHTLNILKNGELFFIDPTTFNDPFDCSIDKIDKFTDEELSAFLKKNNCTDEQIDVILSKNKSGTLDLKDYSNTDNKNTLRIFCLSKIYNHILMWSHYADMHKGICIGFNTTIYKNNLTILCKENQIEDKHFHLPVFRVEYKDEKYEPIKLFNFHYEDLCRFIYRKAKCWSYEEEYRITFSEEQLLQNPVIIDHNEISEVHFGLKTEKDKEKEIIEIIRSLPNKNIRIYKMIEVRGKYQIEREIIL